MRDEAAVTAVGWARSLPVSSGVKAARDWTRSHLETLDWFAREPDQVDAVLLTVSELVTNAHIHAHSDAQLILTWDCACLHVTVHDSAGGLPQPREASEDALGGRGLMLVDAMADQWQIRSCTRGKDVIACFRPATA
ncbi:ATP-binding protein [Streptomyces sp. NPDC047123]|uniref:ATP-binding protein n=1 Tax=Streptomyces sp. NPDC047123 TaxID=3155622 RepID=UPI0033CA65AF